MSCEKILLVIKALIVVNFMPLHYLPGQSVSSLALVHLGGLAFNIREQMCTYIHEGRDGVTN